MSDQQPKGPDLVQLALISAADGPSGELAFDATLELLHHYDDIDPALSHGEMAAQVALQNAARALLRRIGTWPRYETDAIRRHAITRAYLQIR